MTPPSHLAKAFFHIFFLISLSACLPADESHSPSSEVSLPVVPEPVNEIVSTDQRVGPWFASYHEEIEGRVAKTDLGRLLDRKMEPDDFQVRVWEFNIRQDYRSELEGFVLTRDGSHWTSHSVIDFFPTAGLEIGEPKIGWQAAWKEAVDLGILTLPDAEFSTCGRREISNGSSFVFEVKVGPFYRTYMYSVPDGTASQNFCEEQIRVEQIIRVLTNRFGAFRH